jgi:hypothetical protein
VDLLPVGDVNTGEELDALLGRADVGYLDAITGPESLGRSLERDDADDAMVDEMPDRAKSSDCMSRTSCFGLRSGVATTWSRRPVAPKPGTRRAARTPERLRIAVSTWRRRAGSWRSTISCADSSGRV